MPTNYWHVYLLPCKQSSYLATWLNYNTQHYEPSMKPQGPIRVLLVWAVLCSCLSQHKAWESFILFTYANYMGCRVEEILKFHQSSPLFTHSHWSINSHLPLTSLATIFSSLLLSPSPFTPSFPVLRATYCCIWSPPFELHLTAFLPPPHLLTSQFLIGRGKKAWKEIWEWLTGSFSCIPLLSTAKVLETETCIEA